MITQLAIWEQPEPQYVDVHHPVILAQFGYLELNTIRLFLISLSKWDYHATDSVPIRVYFREYIPHYKGGTHWEQGKAAVHEIRKRMKDVNIETLSERGKRVYSSMSVYDLVKHEENTDYVDLTFGVAIQKYLRDLKGRFSSAELQEMFSFRSYYTVRLYLIGKMFYPGFDALELSLAELKSMLIGQADTYDEYKHLKDKILKPSLAAIANTSASMVMEEKKSGRSVTGLVFRPAPSRLLPVEPVRKLPEEVRKVLEEHKVNLKKIEALYAAGEMEADYILHVVHKKKAEKSILKLGAAIHSAIVKKEGLAEFLNPKGVLKKPIAKPAPAAPTVIQFTESEVLTAYETSKGKKEGLPLKEWVDKIYIDEGFKREKIGEVWYLIKR